VILPPIKTKTGRKMKPEVKTKVVEFYLREDVSRCCPGEKDTVSVKDPITGIREHKRKHYLLANLLELYDIVKQDGYTSFLNLRPAECFSLTTKGCHKICVCIHHENVKLLYHSIQ
jgi:hypothetical protein